MNGLVLGGGGSKGAYEIGCIKALNELGYDFDIVTGASVGALNGAFYLMGNISDAVSIWENLTFSSIVRGDLNNDYDIDYLLDHRGELIPFIKNYLEHGGLDITPLKELIKEKVDTNLIKSSTKKLYINMVKVPFLTSKEVLLNSVAEEKMGKYLLASSSCFPAFPLCVIDNEFYIDGGYYDNLPIKLAFKNGATNVVAIDLNYNKLTHKEYVNDPRVTYITPSWNLGNFLDFDNTSIKNNINLGYLDIMKRLGNLKGIKYTFDNDDCDYNDILSSFNNEIDMVYQKYHFNNNHFLNDYLNSYRDDSIFYKGLENVMLTFNYSPYEKYNVQDVITEIKNNDYLNLSLEEEERCISINNLIDLYKLVKNTNDKFIIKFLNYLLYKSDKDNRYIKFFIEHFPKRTIAILFIHSIMS